MSTDKNTAPLTVGDRFEMDFERPYTVDGIKHVHSYTQECRVTSTDAVGFGYEVLSMTNEKNRPSFAGYPIEGSMAWFALPLRIARGTLRIGE